MQILNSNHSSGDLPCERLWVESAIPTLGINKDTFTHYTRQDTQLGRVFEEDRIKLHQVIREQILGSATSVSLEIKPVAILLMGLPGAGKTTLIEQYANKRKNKTGNDVVVLGIDNIVKKIPEFQQALNIKINNNQFATAKDAWEISRIEACYINDQLRTEAIHKRMHFIYDATGTSALYNELINGDLAQTYKVKIIYVDVPLEVAKQRIKLRRNKDGRRVAKSFIYNTDAIAKLKFMEHARNPKLASVKIINNENLPYRVCKINNGNIESLAYEQQNYMSVRGFNQIATLNDQML